MINIVNDILLTLFGSNNRCYRCGKRLKISIINGETKEYCSNGHVEYYYLLNNVLFMSKYEIGKYILVHSTGFNYISVFKYKASYWHDRLFKMPYFDIEEYTSKQVENKIRMHLVFS